MWLEEYFGLGLYDFSDSDTKSEGGYASDDVWEDDSAKSEESNAEEEIFYEENPYCIKW